MVEACRRLDVNLRPYLMHGLSWFGDWSSTRWAEFTPAAWKAATPKSPKIPADYHNGPAPPDGIPNTAAFQNAIRFVGYYKTFSSSSASAISFEKGIPNASAMAWEASKLGLLNPRSAAQLFFCKIFWRQTEGWVWHSMLR